MKTDALSRRLRFAAPQPFEKRLVIGEADREIFAAIERHGPLHTPYLYEFTKHLRKDYSHLQNRLTELFNGTEEGAYLVRPPRQFDAFEARYQPVIYDLGPLARHGSRKRTDHFLHQFMSACVGASIELTARKKGIRYISRAGVIAHPKCPEATAKSPNPLVIPVYGFDKKAIIPDDLFALEYPDAGFRFFAVEIDRNTESIERKSAAQNTFAKKIEGYCDILRNKTYRTHWGIPNLTVLTISTNETHIANIVGHLAKTTEPKLAAKFAFKAEPTFGTNWRVPRELLSGLLTEPWKTSAGPKDISVP